MAKQLNYTDAFGDVYPESYWRVEAIRLDKQRKQAHFEFIGYQDAARKGGKQVGVVLYNVDNDLYDEFFAVTILDTTNPIAQAYQYANQHPGVLLGQGLPTMFFEGAIDV